MIIIGGAICPAVAIADGGLFLQGGIGNVDVNSSYNIYINDEFSYNAGLGYKLNRYLSTTLSYNSLGTISSGDYDVRNFSFGITPTLPLGNWGLLGENELFATVGGHWWDVDMKIPEHLTGTDLYWSVGWKTYFTSNHNLSSYLSYSKYYFNDDFVDFSINDISIGVLYEF